MLIHCLLQVLSIGLILHVFRTDERFEAKGSHLGASAAGLRTTARPRRAGRRFRLELIVAIQTSHSLSALYPHSYLEVPLSYLPSPEWQLVSPRSIPTVRTKLTAVFVGAGKPWAAGKSARKARRHRRTRSGRVVAVPIGEPIPDDQIITVGEVEAAVGGEVPTERTGLLVGQEGSVAGRGHTRATDDVV